MKEKLLRSCQRNKKTNRYSLKIIAVCFFLISFLNLHLIQIVSSVFQISYTTVGV